MFIEEAFIGSVTKKSPPKHPQECSFLPPSYAFDYHIEGVCILLNRDIGAPVAERQKIHRRYEI